MAFNGTSTVDVPTVRCKVLEPVAGQTPGADQFTLKAEIYEFQKIVFVRSDYVDITDPSKCTWRKDKTRKMSVAEVAVLRHPDCPYDPAN